MSRSKTRKLFIPSKGSDRVLLNWVGQPEEHLKFYAEAFHNTGKKLAAQYKDEWPLSSFEACPIVYLYRHAFELYLKAVLVYGNELLQWRGKAPINLEKVIGKESTHFLARLIPELERVFQEAGWMWDMGIDGFRSRKDFTDIIAEFDEYDENSFAFRYPMNKKQTAALPKNFSFGMAHFMSLMDLLLEALYGVICGLEQIVDDERRAAGD
jgi:hypothetical protein